MGATVTPASACGNAVKAVEATLRPIVCPEDSSATLGRVISELRKDLSLSSQRWGVTASPTSTHAKNALKEVPEPDGYRSFIGIVSALWPGPQRHPDGSGQTVADELGKRALAMPSTWSRWSMPVIPRAPGLRGDHWQRARLARSVGLSARRCHHRMVW